jgi:hypothetical protein
MPGMTVTLSEKDSSWKTRFGRRVIPLAFICGPIRGIPFWWRVIDCSFGVFGALPLLYCLRLVRRMQASQGMA